MVNLKQCKWCAFLGCRVLIILMLAGCRDPFDRKFGLSDLESPDTRVNIMAIKWAGDNKISEAVPQLVDFLQSEDNSVRFYAIGALRRITDTDHGYDYKADPYSRALAVKRWREFLDSPVAEPNEL